MGAGRGDIEQAKLLARFIGFAPISREITLTPGTLTAERDPKGRPTIYDRLPKEMTFIRELLVSNLWRSPELGLATPRPEPVEETKAVAKG